MGYIYKITNTVNNKSYIGVTVQSNVLLRFNSHITSIRRGKGCPLLAKAVKKYGEVAFTFKVLIICFDEDVLRWENDYILKYNTKSPNGYNILDGGNCKKSFLGKKHTEETKKIIGKKSKECHNRSEVKEIHRQSAIKLNEMRKNGDLTDKWKKSIEDGKMYIKGSKHLDNLVSNEVRKKISDIVTLYFSDSINKQKHIEVMRKVNGRKIEQYDKENNLIATYNSIIEATEKTISKRSAIQACCSGRSKTSGGYIWKYANTEPKASLN
jgi:group I intron endonuclease